MSKWPCHGCDKSCKEDCSDAELFCEDFVRAERRLTDAKEIIQHLMQQVETYKSLNVTPMVFVPAAPQIIDPNGSVYTMTHKIEPPFEGETVSATVNGAEALKLVPATTTTASYDPIARAKAFLEAK